MAATFGVPTYSGPGISGTLFSSVTLTGNGGELIFTQLFNAGSTLSFQLTTTNNLPPGSSPDFIRVFVNDSVESLCGPDPALLSLNLTGQPLSPASFVVNGSCPTVLTTTITTATGGGGGNGGGGGGTNVPEPSSVLLLGTGLLGLMGMGLYKKRLA